MVLEVHYQTDFNLTCISVGFNHSWHFEPEDFLIELEKRMTIAYLPLDERAVYISTLSVHNASYLNSGNFTCGNGPLQQQSVSVFVKDPENPVIIKDWTLNVEAGHTLDYLCRPTDPSLKLVLKIDHDHLESAEELTPGVQYDFMDVYYSKYRGFTLVNLINHYCTIYCYVGNSSESWAHYDIDIYRPEFIGEPEITMKPSTTAVGTTITLNCSITAYLNPSIEWILPDPKLNESGSFKEEHHIHSAGSFCTSASLTITNARKLYSGNYTCKAYYHSLFSKISTKSLEIIDFDVLNITISNQHLTRLDPPEIDVEPGTEKQEINVTIISNPALKKITWYHDGQQIYDHQSSFQTLYDSDGIITLVIKEPKPKHSGLYTLHVENSKLRDSMNITVKVKDLVGVDGPESVVEGENVTLVCGVSKYKSNSSQLDWCWLTSEGTEECLNTTRTTTSYTHRVTLNIVNVTKMNSGVYTCQENKHIVDHYKMDVKGAVKPNICKPVTTTIDVKADYPITLHCNTSGVPSPTISWFKNDKPLDFNGIELSNKNQTLSIPQGVDMRAAFKCRVVNHVGSDTITYTISVQGDYEVLYFLVTVMLIAVMLYGCVIYIIKTYMYKKEIKELKKLVFNDGKIEEINPEIDIRDQADLLPYKAEFEFPRDKLKLANVLGSGAFGLVMKGEAYGLFKPGDVTTVAVKMPKPNCNLANIKALVSELKIMIHIGKHVNVVNVLGACTGEIYKRELLVLVEYCEYGNLHNYLQKHKEVFINQINPKTGNFDPSIVQHKSLSTTSSEDSEVLCNSMLYSTCNRRESVLFSTATDSPLLSINNASCSSGASLSVDTSSYIDGSNYLTKQVEGQHTYRSVCTQDLISWSFQIARGMEYLTSKKVLHGDLAARNVLLTDHNIVKICDFGLSKNMYKDYYQKMGDDPLPVKWMALESIQYGLFSSQSDVWAYGVTLWELFSLGQTPYSDIANYKELIKQLEHGYRMDQPTYATKELYKIMKNCWRDTPDERPSFSELTNTLSRLLGDLTTQQYLEINDTFTEENTKSVDQEHYLRMRQPPSYVNMTSECAAEPHESTPMMGNSKRDVILVNNRSYNKWAPLSSYVDMNSSKTKGFA